MRHKFIAELLLVFLAAVAAGCRGVEPPGRCLPLPYSETLSDGGVVTCLCQNCQPGCSPCLCFLPDGGSCSPPPDGPAQG